MPPLELAKLAFSLLLGTWKHHPLVSERQVQEVTLNFRRLKATAKAVIDGELVDLEKRVELKMHRGALQVIVPKVDAPATPKLPEAA